MNLAEQLLTQSTDLIWVVDADQRLVFMNQAFRNVMQNVLGREPELNELVANLAPDNPTSTEWESYYTRAFHEQNFEIESHVEDPITGEITYFHTHFQRILEQSTQKVYVTCQSKDVTKQIHRRQAMNALLAKVRVSFIERSLSDAGWQLCRAIQEFGDFDLVELWLPNMEQSELLRTAYESKSVVFDSTHNSRSNFKIGEGLPGHTWLKKKQLLWSYEEINKFFLRKEEANEAGIGMLLGVPLRYEQQLTGVLIIGTPARNEFLGSFGGLIERLETVIGSEIYRKRLEGDLRNLYRAIPDILCLADFQGKFVRINPAGCRLLGYSESEILQRFFVEFLHPDDVEKTINQFRESLEKGLDCFKIENRYLTRAGDIVWLSWTCNTSVEDGVVYASAKDVTKEKQLRELNKQANAMAKIGYWEIDLETNDVYWSEMVHHIHGTDPESYRPDLETALGFYREDFRPIVTNFVNQSLQNGESFDFEAVIVASSGVEHWVRCIGKTELLGSKPTKVYGSFQDIHASKSLEIQIKEILGSISDGFYAVDQTWNFTYVNDRAGRLLKKSAEELIGKNIWVVFPGAVEGGLQEKYEMVVRTNEPYTFEFFYPSEGEWYECSAYPSKSGLSVYFRNISDRKLHADALHQAYEEKNNILESIGEAFFTVDKNWVVTYWNHVAEQVSGVMREDIVGKVFWDVIADIEGTEFFKRLYWNPPQVDPITFDDFYEPQQLWIEVSAYPTPDGFSLFIRDKTGRKKAEEEIQKANDRFVLATEATQDAIWDWDIEKDTIYRSKNILNFYGQRALDVLRFDEYWAERFHPDDVEPFRRSMEAVLKDPTQTRWELEYRIFNEDDALLYVIDRGIIIRNSEGKPVRMVGAMTDLTRQKMLERELIELNASLNKYANELERSNEELEQFAFITSHDLQEPLRMISSFMEQLKRKYGERLDDKAHQYIHFAMDGAKRMKQVILDLLEYSRAGRLTDRLEPISLEQLLIDFKLLRRKLIAEKKAQLHYSNLPTIVSSKVGVTQVIHSLLDNALKYTRPGVPPIIRIQVVEDEVQWTFSVEDNGIGIAKEFYQKIFMIFQRLHNRDEYEGTGVGLSIAKRHIESLGGTISVDSNPSVGTKFTFTIPKPPKSSAHVS